MDRSESGECRITIDRSHENNALARSVLSELADAVAAVGKASDSRVVILSGASERFFAAGGDLLDLDSVRDEAATRQALAWGLADATIGDGRSGRDMQDFLAPMPACPPQVLRGITAQTAAWRQGAAYDACRGVEQRHLIEVWLHDDHWRASEKLLSKGKR